MKHSAAPSKRSARAVIMFTVTALAALAGVVILTLSLAHGGSTPSQSASNVLSTAPAVEPAVEVPTSPSVAPTAPVDASTAPVEPPTDTPATQSEYERANGLSIPSVGLSAPLAAMAFAPVLVPGDHEAAWEVMDEQAGWAGDPASTRLITLHSCGQGRICPGNPLIGSEPGTAAVVVGDAVWVEGDEYAITSVDVFAKDGVPASVYASGEGRLVIVTCSPEADRASSRHNVVVVAVRV